MFCSLNSSPAVPTKFLSNYPQTAPDLKNFEMAFCLPMLRIF
ncbi:hypothetical protein AVDCRST_MAG84-525 [uncultured Microcoleus sp.]|uniref:Uncharacterized protein n=1 Tax=uncultured Microcoleus sp. TaxID=259945 RepID=A0A6J4KM68_9CYAN|nr:hypothetical protein AVDCRST_MAG84-525 [uncultured Microcoleus sp.]